MYRSDPGGLPASMVSAPAPFMKNESVNLLRRMGCLVFAVALGILGDRTAAAAAEGNQGSLVIIGGGPRPSSVTERFIQLAGGTNRARLVIIPFASDDPRGSGRSVAEEFNRLGIPVTDVLEDMGEAAVRRLERATGVYFTGGDQKRLVTAMTGTPALEAVRTAWRRGSVIAGTSAGAAVMSARMITGEEAGNPSEENRFRSIQRGYVEMIPGFGFITNAIVDQHFIARRRENRLFSVVLENTKLLGVGIDESTAVVVGPDQTFEVVGNQTVLVVDARHAGAVHEDPRKHLGATDLRIHILVNGDRFNLRTARPLSAQR